MVEIDTLAGVLTRHPGNQGGGPSGYYDLERAARIPKQGLEAKDESLQKASLAAATEYLNGRAAAEILGSNSTALWIV